MSAFSDLRDQHEAELDAAGYDDGFVTGFLAGATVSMNYIMGWRGETRNPDREVALEELGRHVVRRGRT